MKDSFRDFYQHTFEAASALSPLSIPHAGSPRGSANDPERTIGQRRPASSQQGAGFACSFSLSPPLGAGRGRTRPRPLASGQGGLRRMAGDLSPILPLGPRLSDNPVVSHASKTTVAMW